MDLMTFTQLAACGLGTTTAWRYVNETVELLARPRPEAPRRGPGREEGRSCLRDPERDADPY
jgi:hypothetical protein